MLSGTRSWATTFWPSRVIIPDINLNFAYYYTLLLYFLDHDNILGLPTFLSKLDCHYCPVCSAEDAIF